MSKLMLLAVLVLLVVTLRCDSWQDECYSDSDCDDGNPCTEDDCIYWSTGGWDPDRSCWSDTSAYFRCRYSEDDDGTACEVDGQSGVCEVGECRLDGETPDAGVSDGGV